MALNGFLLTVIASFLMTCVLSQQYSSSTTQASTGCICFDLFLPVCGVDGKNYSNSCFAACAGVSVAYNSSCTAAPANPTTQTSGILTTTLPSTQTTGSSSTQNTSPVISTAATASSCICTLEFNPVCGADGNNYGNACAAKCAGTYVAHQGNC